LLLKPFAPEFINNGRLKGGFSSPVRCIPESTFMTGEPSDS
jgi:hypothetical protein